MLTAIQLKPLSRTGWVRKGISNPETVAAHSWGVAFLVLNTLPDHLSLEKALSYAVLHDLGESITGDFTPLDNITKEEKLRKETLAMQNICSGLARGEQIMQCWLDYEAQQNPEAQFVRELDRLDMAIQALHYASGHGTHDHWREFFDSAQSYIQDPVLTPLIKEVRNAYEALTAKISTPQE